LFLDLTCNYKNNHTGLFRHFILIQSSYKWTIP
jgi:hypothetical protein